MAFSFLIENIPAPDKVSLSGVPLTVKKNEMFNNKIKNERLISNLLLQKC